MFIKTFLQLNKNDTAIAGGKRVSLGEMTQTGIPVPFVEIQDTTSWFIAMI